VINLLGRVRGYYKKLTNTTDEFWTEGLKAYGEVLEDRLIRGVKKGYDIKGNQFKHLKPSRIRMRQWETGRAIKKTIRGAKAAESLGRKVASISIGGQGTSPMHHTGKLIRQMKSSRLFFVDNSGLKIKLFSNPNVDGYYLLHNQQGGYISAGAIPGQRVRQRKWYGIPKTFAEGGVGYKKALAAMTRVLRHGFETVVEGQSETSAWNEAKNRVPLNLAELRKLGW